MPTHKPSPPSNADNPEQSRRFIDAARKAEADEAPGATERGFEKVIPKTKRARKGSTAESELGPK